MFALTGLLYIIIHVNVFNHSQLISLYLTSIDLIEIPLRYMKVTALVWESSIMVVYLPCYSTYINTTTLPPLSSQHSSIKACHSMSIDTPPPPMNTHQGSSMSMATATCSVASSYEVIAPKTAEYT